MKNVYLLRKFKMLMFAMSMVFVLVSCGKNDDSAEKNTTSDKNSTLSESVDNSEKNTQEGKEENASENKEDETEDKTTIKDNDKGNDDDLSLDVKIDNVDDFENIVAKDLEDAISALQQDCDDLINKINSYDKYKKNTDDVEEFYNNIYKEHQKLTIRLMEYAVVYAEIIVTSDMPYDDMYDEMEKVFEVVYDDGGDYIFDEIYDGILDDLFDAFYDGILDDAFDTESYSEVADFRSDEYDWWSDTRSDIYDDWSDFRSDVYDFWCDVKSEIWDDNVERALKEINDFKGDISKLK